MSEFGNYDILVAVSRVTLLFLFWVTAYRSKHSCSGTIICGVLIVTCSSPSLVILLLSSFSYFWSPLAGPFSPEVWDDSLHNRVVRYLNHLWKPSSYLFLGSFSI